jgi:integrase
MSACLLFLFSTGCRRGEALGLKWEDVDFDRRSVTIRRAVTLRRVTTPKSRRGWTLAPPRSLALELFDLLAARCARRKPTCRLRSSVRRETTPGVSIRLRIPTTGGLSIDPHGFFIDS